MTLRQADSVFAPSMKVGITATVVLVAGGLTGQQHLVGLAALGALVSAFGRYQPYGRLARQLAMVAVSLLVATGAGALMGAAGVAPWLVMVVLSLIAGLASHIFHAFKITGPGAVILVFAASAGTSTAHSFADVGPVLLAVFLGALVGWLIALAPVLFFPMGPARLATAGGSLCRAWHRGPVGGKPGTSGPARSHASQGARPRKNQPRAAIAPGPGAAPPVPHSPHGPAVEGLAEPGAAHGCCVGVGRMGRRRAWP